MHLRPGALIASVRPMQMSGHCQVKRRVAPGGKLGEAGGMTPQPITYYRRRFPADIISHAVWLYHMFSLSLRDVELILAERGLSVTHESIRGWCGIRCGVRQSGSANVDHDPAMSGIWTRCSSGSMVSCTICGGLSISMAWCSTSWCKIDGMPQQPSASSSGCCKACIINRAAWSLTVCVATASRIARCCQMSGTGKVGY